MLAALTRAGLTNQRWLASTDHGRAALREQGCVEQRRCATKFPSHPEIHDEAGRGILRGIFSKTLLEIA